MKPTNQFLTYGLIIAAAVSTCVAVVSADRAPGEAQIQASADAIVLQNEFLSRKLKFGPDGLSTVEFKNLVTQKDYATGAADEFAFAVDGVEVTGGGASSAFRYVRHAATRPKPGESLLRVELDGRPGTAAESLAVGVDYTLCDRLPFIRKKLSIINRSPKEIVLTNLDVERLQMTPVTEFLCEVIANHGASLTRIPYTGDYNDSVVLVWNPAGEQGFIIGNEAFGVMKRTEVYSKPQRVSVGLTRIGQHYPFKKYLAPGETIDSPGTFVGLYQGEKWQDAFEGQVC